MREWRRKADWFCFGLAGAFLATLWITAAFHVGPIWISAAYSGSSALTLATYAWDKRKAHRGEWRVPESRLHWLELLGGWPGALVAQRFFRHKTRKVRFQIVFWLIVTAHLALLGCLVTRGF